MPENWKTYKFSELFETASGLSKSRDQFGFGSPFLTFKDVFYNYFIPPELGDLANTSEKEQIRGSVKRGDIFLTRTSETLHELGMSSVALKDYPNSTFNGFCKRLRQKKGSTVKIHPEFIGYFLRSNRFRNEVSQHATMTTRASLNNTSISSLSVTLPPFPEQVEIGSILKVLDDKIELNFQMNKTLEEMAMALFKHWFVDFGPFQDGEFVDSELGEIPKGWKVLELGDVSTLGAGGDKPKVFSKQPNEKCNVPIFSNGISDEGLYGFTDQPKIYDESITVSARGTIGFVCLRMEPYVPIVRLISIVPNKEFISSKYLYLWLKNQNITGTGTTQQQLTVPDFRVSKILIPNVELVNDFTLPIDDIYNKIVSNKDENLTLTQLRDTLLPKLISGEVRVKDAEKTLSEIL